MQNGEHSRLPHNKIVGKSVPTSSCANGQNSWHGPEICEFQLPRRQKVSAGYLTNYKISAVGVISGHSARGAVKTDI